MNKNQNNKQKLSIGGPMGKMMNTEKPKNFKKTMKNLLSYLRPYRASIIIVIFFAFGSAAFSIVGPKILGNATTAIFEGLVSKVSGSSGIDFIYVGKIILILLVLYGISALFSFIQGFIMTGVAQKVTFKLRKSLSEKINRMPLKYFDKHNHGEVLSRITNDVDTLGQNLSQGLSDIVTSVTTIIGILIMMISINFFMTLATLLIIPISLVLISFTVKRTQKYFKTQQEYIGHINGYVEEIYSGHNIIKSFNNEEKAVEDFATLNDKLYKTAWKAQFFSGMMMPIITFVGNLSYVGVSILGGWLAIQGKIKVGDILAFIQYVRSFMQPISNTAQIASVFQYTIAAAERVFEFINEEEEPTNSNVIDNLDDIKGAVEFKNINFGYDKNKIIINDFSIKIKPGQNVAIVGPTGAGKTTIVKLLMRFYDLNSGSILIDNYDITKIKKSDLRKNIGMVLQDTWLFNGTIMDNIRYGKLEASDEEVKAAAKAAYVDHFVHTLPEGYDLVLNEETNNISQGQKQLLTIARAILANPKILILDEATSSVDTRTEVLIQTAMENLMKDRTSFIIAHRLSTIKNADLILVMKDGDIVEHGKHNQLLKNNGFYANLYNSQFEEELS
ncbi:MAG: ABC transporter ATP-binding protein [Mollicutes bacterium]|nr:ABC transporter ATP-binding protein [Mollicutes bacterium]